MKETPISTCEKEFIAEAIKQNQRLDGRRNDEFRNIDINFGCDWGSVLVALGETRVLAEVSCTLGLPKTSRPTEGILFINVELGPMAAPHFEAGRNSELNVQINRTLERTLKDSRCIDLESLCVTAEERVWILRVGLNVLNHEGNLIDCCSIAALCALAHFRRPEVTITDNEVHIHTAAEKEEIPMVLHHYPVCLSYCTFDEGGIAVADPTAIEERTAESHLVFGINSFRELCCLNLGGKTLTSSNLLLQCSKRAALRAKFVVDRIKAALQQDMEAREAGSNVGFTECLRLNKITSYAEGKLALRLRHFNFNTVNDEEVPQDVPPAAKQEHASPSDNEMEQATAAKTEATVRWIPEEDDEDMNIANVQSDNINTDDEDDEI